MSDYFGILKDRKLDKLSKKQLTNLVNESDLFYVSNTMKLDLVDGQLHAVNTPLTQNILLRKEVSDALYNYLKKIFKVDIETSFLEYFSVFNQMTFGLNTSECKEIALKKFKELYENVKAIDLEILHRNNSESGIDQVDSLNEFVFLKGKQNALKSEISNLRKPYAFKYLSGSIVFFEKENLIKFTRIKQLIEFESALKILLSLNDLYKFKDDFEFGKLSQLKEIYQKYKHPFNEFDVFVFVYETIENFTSKKHATIYSLYDAILQLHLVKGNKTNFFNYVNEIHHYDLTKIITYEKGSNFKHDERVKIFMIDLEKYSDKK